jgi:hypothetical protein
MACDLNHWTALPAQGSARHLNSHFAPQNRSSRVGSSGPRSGCHGADVTSTLHSSQAGLTLHQPEYFYSGNSALK